MISILTLIPKFIILSGAIGGIFYFSSAFGVKTSVGSNKITKNKLIQIPISSYLIDIEQKS